MKSNSIGVCDGGEDAVSLAALPEGVVELGVQTAAVLRQLALTPSDAPAGVRVAVGRWNAVVGVVEVPAPVRPADVVKQEDGKAVGVVAGQLRDEHELVEDRVPIVVAVDQPHLEQRQFGDRVQADIPVEDQSPGVRIKPLNDV